jgi:hypothetical protein
LYSFSICLYVLFCLGRRALACCTWHRACACRFVLAVWREAPRASMCCTCTVYNYVPRCTIGHICVYCVLLSSKINHCTGLFKFTFCIYSKHGSPAPRRVYRYRHTGTVPMPDTRRINTYDVEDVALQTVPVCLKHADQYLRYIEDPLLFH